MHGDAAVILTAACDWLGGGGEHQVVKVGGNDFVATTSSTGAVGLFRVRRGKESFFDVIDVVRRALLVVVVVVSHCSTHCHATDAKTMANDALRRSHLHSVRL